ncbi:MAG: neutral zinc metallopeptidase [Marmoricola sp.]
MRFNPRATIDQSENESRAGGGGGGMGGGRLTLGGVLVLGVVFLINQFTGVDLSGLIGAGGSGSGSDQTVATSCRTGADANKSDECAIKLITTSVQDYWHTAFPDQVSGSPAYEPIQTVTFRGSTASGCGQASSAMGPFYCPNDKKVYIDTTFMDDMLKGDLGAQGGPFALAYVVGHEYGHHIEDQLGILGRMKTQQGPRSDSVKAELMADCLGGMWARNAEQTKDANGVSIIEGVTADDISRAIDAATAVGDDRIQKRSGGGVDTESWTHGSSAQRVHWFNVGLKEGSLDACNTFAPGALS